MENETIEQESNNQSLATIDVALLAEDEGAGLENVSSDDLLIPSLKLVQKGSPFVDPTESTYTEEVKVGDNNKN